MSRLRSRRAGRTAPPPPGDGVHVRFDELNRLRAEAVRLAAAGPDLVGGLFPGVYRSLFRGRGLDFEEVRGYQSGDDYRLVDWRVTARTGRLHTKIFREEREHTVFFVLDAGPGMQFGTRSCFKWVAACRAAALVAWLAVDNGDRIGALVYGDGRRCHELRPATGQRGAARLFRLLERASPPAGRRPLTEGGAGLGEALGRLRRLARPGSLVLVAGDFAELDPAVSGHLAQLVRHVDLAMLQVFDPMEAEPPPPGRRAFTDGDRVVSLETGAPALRTAWAADFEARRMAVAELCRRYRLRHAMLRTDEPPVETLRRRLFRLVPATEAADA